MGGACIADDILIYGVGDTIKDAMQDHDRNLTSVFGVLQREVHPAQQEKVVLRVEQLECNTVCDGAKGVEERGSCGKT